MCAREGFSSLARELGGGATPNSLTRDEIVAHPRARREGFSSLAREFGGARAPSSLTRDEIW